MRVEAIDMIPNFAFWREGCRTFAKNLWMTLALAEPEFGIDKLLMLVKTLPRSRNDLLSSEWQRGYCSRCLERISETSPNEAKRMIEYMGYFADRSYPAQVMLIDGFLGVVLGIDELKEEDK